jgi:hypothetical protein
MLKQEVDTKLQDDANDRNDSATQGHLTGKGFLVMITDKFKFKTLVETVALTVNQMLERLKKTFHGRSLKLCRILYLTYTRLQLSTVQA